MATGRYRKVTPEARAEIARLAALGESGRSIAHRLNLGESRVTDIIREQRMRDETPVTLSTKMALLGIIAERGPFADVDQLLSSSPDDRLYDAHNVVHLLYSLNKQGWVRFKVQGRRAGGAFANAPLNITATPAGFRAVQPKAPPVLPAEVVITAREADEASTTPVPVAAVTEIPAARTESPWPELVALMTRWAGWQKEQERMTRLFEAAERLEEMDPEMSRLLLERAEEVSRESYLSPLEAEYVVYAREHP